MVVETTSKHVTYILLEGETRPMVPFNGALMGTLNGMRVDPTTKTIIRSFHITYSGKYPLYFVKAPKYNFLYYPVRWSPWSNRYVCPCLEYQTCGYCKEVQLVEMV